MIKLITILQVLIYTTYLAELTPLILFLFFLRKNKESDIRVFFIYTLSIAFFLFLSLFYKLYLKDAIHQLIVNRVFLLVEFTLLSIYYFHLIKNCLKKIILPPIICFFFLYSIYDFYLSKPGEFSFIPLVKECFFFILLIIYFLYEKIKFNVSASVYSLPSFWISVAFLIYFSGNFFLFLFSKSMFKNPDFRFQYTIIYSSVTIIKNIFICTGIYTNSLLLNKENTFLKKIDIDLGTFNPLPNKPNL